MATACSPKGSLIGVLASSTRLGLQRIIDLGPSMRRMACDGRAGTPGSWVSGNAVLAIDPSTDSDAIEVG
jgi:hypothetical protein